MKYYSIDRASTNIYYYNIANRSTNILLGNTLAGIYIKGTSSEYVVGVLLFIVSSHDVLYRAEFSSLKDANEYIISNLNKLGYIELPEHLKILI
jgi:hypothetical protein